LGQFGNVVFIVWRESIEALLVIGILQAWLGQQGGDASSRGRTYLWAGGATGLVAAGLLRGGALRLQKPSKLPPRNGNGGMSHDVGQNPTVGANHRGGFTRHKQRGAGHVTVSHSGQPFERCFEDLSGMLKSFGIPLHGSGPMPEQMSRSPEMASPGFQTASRLAPANAW